MVLHQLEGYCDWMNSSNEANVVEDHFEFTLNLDKRDPVLLHPAVTHDRSDTNSRVVWPFGQRPYTVDFLSQENRELWCTLYSRFAIGQYPATLALDFGNVISPKNDVEPVISSEK